jgi:hypothetical protein
MTSAFDRLQERFGCKGNQGPLTLIAGLSLISGALIGSERHSRMAEM